MKGGGLYNPKRPQYIAGFENRVRVLIDGTLAAWNTVATHEVFTVTGMVRLLVLYFVRTTIGSAGAAQMSFGREGATSNYAAAQVVTGLTTGVFVVPAGTVSTQVTANSIILQPTTVNADLIISGLDIGYEVTVAALNAGVIEAYCYWSPVSDSGLVVAGAGGAL